MKNRYRNPFLDPPLFVGTKAQMEQHMRDSAMTYRTHTIKKIPFRKLYGIFRKY